MTDPKGSYRNRENEGPEGRRQPDEDESFGDRMADDDDDMRDEVGTMPDDVQDEIDDDMGEDDDVLE